MQYTLILKPPEKIRKRITRIKKNLEARYGYTGSLSCKGVHITMVYLKNPQFLDISSIKRICDNVSPFYFTIDGTDYFEREKNGKKSYIIYLKVTPSLEMMQFHSILMNVLRSNSLDTDKFIPHLTLIRKNVDEQRLNEINKIISNLYIPGRFEAKYLILGKRKKQNTHWYFEHLNFSKI